jgi:hypothetical protein
MVKCCEVLRNLELVKREDHKVMERGGVVWDELEAVESLKSH